MFMTNLRERRRIRTADTIRQVAVDLVYEHGLDHVTTEMISEKAGISPRTFFNYFPYKEAALIPPEQEFSPESVAKFASGTAPLLDDLGELLIPFVEPHGKDPAMLRKLIKLSESHPKLSALKTIAFHDFDQKLAKVLHQRLRNSKEKCDLLAALISTAMRVALVRWVEGQTGAIEDAIVSVLQELDTIFDD